MSVIQTTRREPANQTGHSSEFRVLLVDDDPAFATYLSALLGHQSKIQVTLTHCSNLIDVQAFNVEAEFDVVLLDLGLHETNGVETVECFFDDFGPQPVVVLTGNDEESTALSCVERGAQDYLNKGSIDADLLIRSLRFAIERHRRESLEVRNHDLDQFASIVARCLQAPLKSVDALAVRINEDTDSELSQESRKNLGTLRDRVTLATNMIDGLLAYSRAGQVDPHLQSVNCGRLLAEVIAMLDVPLGFSIDVAQEMPTITTSETALATCLSHLISNAITHHDRSDGLITIECQQVDDCWEFTVTDDGPGISPEYNHRIFLAMETLPSKGEVERSGIGLALVRKTAEAYGGYVDVESDGQRGATFRLGWRPAKETI